MEEIIMSKSTGNQLIAKYEGRRDKRDIDEFNKTVNNLFSDGTSISFEEVKNLITEDLLKFLLKYLKTFLNLGENKEYSKAASRVKSLIFDGTLPCTDGENIYINVIHCLCSTNILNKTNIVGFLAAILLHETQHVLMSDFSLMKKVETDPVIDEISKNHRLLKSNLVTFARMILNIFEDRRVDRVSRNEYPETLGLITVQLNNSIRDGNVCETSKDSENPTPTEIFNTFSRLVLVFSKTDKLPLGIEAWENVKVFNGKTVLELFNENRELIMDAETARTAEDLYDICMKWMKANKEFLEFLLVKTHLQSPVWEIVNTEEFKGAKGTKVVSQAPDSNSTNSTSTPENTDSESGSVDGTNHSNTKNTQGNRSGSNLDTNPVSYNQEEALKACCTIAKEYDIHKKSRQDYEANLLKESKKTKENVKKNLSQLTSFFNPFGLSIDDLDVQIAPFQGSELIPTNFLKMVRLLTKALSFLLSSPGKMIMRQKTGKITGRSIIPLAKGDINSLVRFQAKDTSMAISMIVDASGSMLEENKQQYAEEMSIVIEQAIVKLKIPLEIASYTTTSKKVLHTIIRAFEDKKNVCRTYNYYKNTTAKHNSNADGLNIAFAGNRLLKDVNAKTKLMFILSDGEPSPVGKENPTEVVRAAVQLLLKNDIIVVPIFFGQSMMHENLSDEAKERLNYMYPCDKIFCKPEEITETLSAHLIDIAKTRIG